MKRFYNWTAFDCELEARYAAFFDLAGWQWVYKPHVKFNGWAPTFWVSFPCQHSECNGHHTLFIEVLPCETLRGFMEHPCLDYAYGNSNNPGRDEIPADSSAAFGISPEITWWEMGHGAGGGEECVRNWVKDYLGKWEEAFELIAENLDL